MAERTGEEIGIETYCAEMVFPRQRRRKKWNMAQAGIGAKAVKAVKAAKKENSSREE